MSLWGNKDIKSGIAGTVTVTAANSTVVAAGGGDLTNFAVGDFLNVGGNDYVFTAIANATIATVRSGVNGGTLVGASANSAYVVSEKPLYVVYSESGGDAGDVYGADTTETGVDAAVVHSGWVKRTVKSRGGSSYDTFETLVAGGSISGDAADDSVLADS